MKALDFFKKGLFFLMVSVVVSCSSDSDGEEVDDKSNATGTLEILFDGVHTEMKNLSSLRYGDKFMIYGDMQNGYFFQMEFHKSGALGHIMVKTDLQNSYRTTLHFNSNYVLFNLSSIDVVNKKIKGNFSGKFFKEGFETLPIGNYKEASGEFEISYKDMEELWGDKFDCKINNIEWNRTSMEYVWASSSETFEEVYYSNNAYRFRYSFNGVNISSGTYSFTPESIKNAIQLEKFDPITNTYLSYDCVGEITFSNLQNLNNGANEVTYDATFHLTATNPENPSDVIQVTNGDAQGRFSLD